MSGKGNKRNVFMIICASALILAAQIISANAQEVLETFDDGEWLVQESGVALSGDSQKIINGWTLNKTDVSKNAKICLEADPYRDGEKSIFIGRPNSWDGGAVIMSKDFEPVSTGAEVSFRFTTPQTFDGRGHFFSVQSSDGKSLVTFGCGLADGDNYTGEDWIGNDVSLGSWSYSFGLYFDTANQPPKTFTPNKQPVVDDRIAYVTIDPFAHKYFIWEERFVKFAFDFKSKQIDVYYDIVPITDQEPVCTVPFIDMTAEDMGKITFGGANSSYGGMYYDDILFSDSGTTPPKPNILYTISDASYTPSENQVTVKSNITKGSEQSGIAFAAAYNTNGVLVGMSNIELIVKDAAFNKTFDVSDEVGSVKVYVWNGFNNNKPLALAVSAQRNDPPAPAGDKVLNATFDDGEWANKETGVAINSPMIFGENHEEEHTRGENTVIDGWVLQGQDFAGSNFQVANDPLGGTNKMLRVVMGNPDWHDSGLKATKEFDPVTNTAIFSYRVTTGNSGNSGNNHYLQLFDNDKPIVTFGGGYCGEDWTGKDWAGRDMRMGMWNNYFGLYFDTAYPGKTKNLNAYELTDGKIPYVMLSGRNKNQTYYVKMILHFDTKTIDVYYSSEPITDETDITVTVPFIDSTASAANKLVLGGAYYSREDIYWDDISVTKSGE